MDLKRPIAYRGFQLNTTNTTPAGINGCQVNTARFGSVPGVGYTEKRALADGLDASDIYLGSRRVFLAGTVYGRTRPEAFDAFQNLRSIISPTVAYAEDPDEKGYLPLTFEEPTDDLLFDLDAVTEVRYRELELRVRPLASLGFDFIRDQSGGVEGMGVSFPWTAAFEARDPRVYGQEVIEAVIDENEVSGGGNLLNRGDYPAPLDIVIVVDSTGIAGTIRVVAGGASMLFTIPFDTSVQIFRYDGREKVLTVEKDDVESLRMDLLDFENQTTHPLIQPGSSAWSWVATDVSLGSGSVVRFSEAYG